MHLPIDALEDLLNELNNALTSQSFQEDWYPLSDDYLVIDKVNSTFISSSLSINDFTLPTLDVVEIIESYKKWIIINKYEKYI